jgi:hypothetical protein
MESTMATQVRTSANFAVFEMRGGGMLIRHLNSSSEVFFQPGDDAQTFRETIAALEEVAENKVDEIFDAVCSEYA